LRRLAITIEWIPFGYIPDTKRTTGDPTGDGADVVIFLLLLSLDNPKEKQRTLDLHFFRHPLSASLA